MKSNFAEMAMCGGFFIIYFIDEFIHFFFGEAIQHTHAAEPAHASGNGYGAISANERAPLLASGSSTTSHHHHDEHEYEK